MAKFGTDKGESLSIKIEDNSELVGEALKTAVDKSLMYMGTTAVRYVVEYMSQVDFTGRDIVDTGRLRGSISFATYSTALGLNNTATSYNTQSDALTIKPNDMNKVIVGTNVEYATDVEYGKMNSNGKMTLGRYYLRNGIQNSLAEIEEGVKNILKGGSL